MADAERASQMAAYMKHLFPFHGIAAPVRRAIQKEVFDAYNLSDQATLHALCAELWDLPEREYQYAAIDLMLKYKKLLTPDSILLAESLMLQKSWWDSVDLLSASICGNYFLKDRAAFTSFSLQWLEHDDMWLNRAAIICQLPHNAKTDADFLAKAIQRHIHSKAFFIQKAIGWALRNYARYNPEWVRQFIAEHTLPALSKREALKHLNKF